MTKSPEAIASGLISFRLPVNAPQLNRVEDTQSQFLRQCQSHPLGSGVIQGVRGMGITAEDHLAALLCGHFPEASVGIMPSLPNTQQIDLQRQTQTFRFSADRPQALRVELPVTIIIILRSEHRASMCRCRRASGSSFCSGGLSVLWQ